MMADLDPHIMVQLQKGIEKMNLSLTQAMCLQIAQYIQILMKWNKVYNLTAIVEPERILTHHILDSLSLIPYIKGNRILDVGSGAGLPGIPCAIACPNKQFTLLDSNGKKARFMTQAIGEIKLKNVEVVQNRVEEYYPQQGFEVIMARAFSSLDNVWSLTKHLMTSDGELLLMKGLYPEGELQKLSNHAKVYKLSVPGIKEQRHLVCIKGSHL